MLTYNTLTETAYIDLVVDLIASAEQLRSRASFPDPNDPRATIGYGYTFNRSDNVAIWQSAGIVLSASDLAALKAIDAAPSTQRDSLAVATFTRVLSKAEAEALLRQTYSKYEGPANDLEMPLSRERAALVSITYNRGAGTVQSRMQGFYTAINNEDRAEAWFQLRYMSWGSSKPHEAGLRSRRLVEAEIFGLYDNPEAVTADEAMSVFRMLQLNRKEILKDESLWGENPDGTPGKRDLIAEVSADPKWGDLPDPETIEQALTPGYNKLIQVLNDTYGLSLDVASYLPTDIYVDPGRTSATKAVDPNHSSTLDATKKADGKTESTANNILIGEGGGDTLIGGQGDDVLLGGDGVDVYIFRSGDGNDLIVDDDGGYVLRNGAYLSPGSKIVGDGQWQNDDGTIRYQKLADNSLQVTFAGSSDVILIKHFNFDAAENTSQSSFVAYQSLGIELAPPPKAILSTTTNIITNLARNSQVDQDVTTALSEGAHQVFTFFVSAATNFARKILLSLSGTDSSQFALITGAAQYDFNNGTVELTLNPGETSLTFSLTNASDTADDGTLNLSAQVVDPNDPQADPIVSNTATINYTSSQNDPAPTNIVSDGDGATRAFNGGTNADLLGQGNITTRTQFNMGGGNDLVAHYNNNDVINAGDGNDMILSADNASIIAGGEQLVHGGAGNDWIAQASGGGTIYGDAGNDAIGTLNVDILSTPLSTPDNAQVNWNNWDVFWQALGPTYNVAFSKGNYSATNGVANFSGGSWGKDAQGNEVLAPTQTLQSTAGSFTTLNGSGVQFNYSFTSTGGVSGTLTLDWTEDGVAKHAEIQISPNTYTPTTSTTASTLDGGEGDDLLVAGSAGDTLIGGAGNDLIQGGSGNDTVYGDGGPGDGLSQANAGNDQIALGAGDDYADGGDGNDIIIGEDGQDTIFGGAGDDVLVAGKWQAGVADQGSGDYLNGEDGNDTLFGSSNADILIGGAGNDVIQGETANAVTFGDDYIDGGDGDDILIGMGGNDTLYGGAGNDIMLGDANGLPDDQNGKDILYGEDGDDQISGNGGDDQLFGGAGDDAMSGDDGDDLLDGGDGDDKLYGGDGNDTLVGGAGQDYLAGQGGDDTYQFELGDSPVINNIYEVIADTEGDNTVRFGAGINVDDVKLTMDQSGQYLMVQYSDQDNFMIDQGLSGSVAWFEFSDGSRYSYADLIGSNSNTPLYGWSNTGSLLRLGGSGNDTITSSAGGATLSGGKGNDYLIGSGGNNTYLYNLGFGNDRIADTGQNSGSSRIRFGDGISPDDISLNYVDGKLVLKIDGSDDDQITLDGFDPDNAMQPPGVGLFEFADGTELTYEDLVSQGINMVGSDSVSDTLTGTSADDVMQGLAGDDTLIGEAGDDQLSGGTGNDILEGGIGDDTYYFNLGDGLDTVVDTDGFNRVVFGDGLNYQDMTVSQRMGIDGENYIDLSFSGGDRFSIRDGGYGYVQQFEFANGEVIGIDDLVANLPLTLVGSDDLDDELNGHDADDKLLGLGGNDTLNGNAGNDRLVGGSGDDVLNGGVGVDTYVFQWNGGNDVINEIAGEQSILELSQGFSSDLLIFNRVGDDLVLSQNGGSGSIRIANYYGDASDWQVRRNDGSLVSMDDLLQTPAAVPTSVDKVIERYRELTLANQIAEWEKEGYTVDANNVAHYQQTDLGYTYIGGVEIPNEQTTTTVSATVQFVTVDPENPQGLPFDISNFYPYYIEGATKYTDSSSSIENSYTTTSYVSEYVPAVPAPDGWVFVPLAVGTGVTLPTTAPIYYQKDSTGNVVGVWYWGATGTPTPGYTVSVPVNTTVTNITEQDTIYLPDFKLTNPSSFALYQDGIVEGSAGDDTIALQSAVPDNWDVGFYGSFKSGGLAYGGDGNDTIVATNGQNILIGGKGQDTLIGGLGSDAFYLLDEDSIDSISDTGTYEKAASQYSTQFTNQVILGSLAHTGGNNYAAIESYYGTEEIPADTLILDAGITLENLQATLSADRTELMLTGPDGYGAQVRLATMANNAGYGIEYFVFGDGTRLTIGQMMDLVLSSSTGTDDVDQINGDALANDIYGLGGNDVINGDAGNDVIYGGAGNDVLNGGAGADILIGGDGDDIYVVDNVDDKVVDQEPILLSGNALGGLIDVDNYVVSRDGQYLIFTSADRFLPGDTESADQSIWFGDVYAKNLVSGAIEKLSDYYGSDVMPRGSVSISADNSRVVFCSVERPNDGAIYLKDLNSGDLITLIKNYEATPSGFTLGISDYSNPTISGNGQYVLFYAWGIDHSNGNESVQGLFRENVDTQELELVAGATYSGLGWISDDGRYVTFQSDNGAGTDIFITDMQGGNVVDIAAEIGDTSSSLYLLDVTSDASKIAFTDSSNVYTLDRDTDQLKTFSFAQIGVTGAIAHASLSSDGQYLAFADASGQAYVLDENTGAVRVLVTGVDGNQANDFINSLTFSADGTEIYLSTAASNLLISGGSGVLMAKNPLLDGENGNDTVLASVSYTLRDEQIENLTLTGADAIDGTGNQRDNLLVGNASSNVLTGLDGNDRLEGGAGSDTLVGGSGSDDYVFQLGDGNDQIIDQSSDELPENRIIFGDGISLSDLSMTRDSNGMVQIRYSATDSISLNATSVFDVISKIQFANGDEYDAETLFPGRAITGTDGNDSLLGTSASDLLYGEAGDDVLDGGPGADFMYGGTGSDTFYVDDSNDVVQDQNPLVLTPLFTDAEAQNLALYLPISTSADGNYVGFTSNRIDNEGVLDAYVKNIETGAITLVSSTADGVQLDGTSVLESVSNDGRYAVFESDADNLIAGDEPGTTNIFLKNLQTGAIQVVDSSPTGQLGDSIGDGNKAQIFGNDDRYVVFTSASSNLVAGASGWNVFIKDMQTGDVRLVSADIGGEQGNADSFLDQVSSDGRYVLFDSYADNLVAGDNNGQKDVFVKDLQTGQVTLVTTSATGKQADSWSYGLQILGGGRYVLFDSDATNLAPGSVAWADNYYIKDLQTGEITHINSWVPTQVSSDGRYLIYGVSDSATQTSRLYAKDLSTGESRLVFQESLAGPDVILGGQFSADGSHIYLTIAAGSDDGTLVHNEFYATVNPFMSNLSPISETDTVISSVSYVLTDASLVEDLTLTGTDALNGTGNNLNNTLTGNSGANVLSGLTGDDILIAGQGNDILNGGAGSDGYWFNLGDGNDTIIDVATQEDQNWIQFGNGIQASDVNVEQESDGLRIYYSANDSILLQGASSVSDVISHINYTAVDSAGNSIVDNYNAEGVLISDSWSNVDGTHGNDIYVSTTNTYSWGIGQGINTIHTNGTGVLDIGAGINADQLWFSQSGDDLEISLLGTQDTITIKGWYLSNTNQLDDIALASSGQTLAAANVQNLVQAMAAFAVPDSGQSQYTAQESQVLQPVLAANWH